MGIHNHYANIKENVPIRIKNKCNYPINLEYLKKYSNRKNINEEKDMIAFFESNKEYEMSIIDNYLKDKNRYEVFLSINNDDKIVSMLLYKEFKIKLISKLYFYKLRFLICFANIRTIIKTIEKN